MATLLVSSKNPAAQDLVVESFQIVPGRCRSHISARVRGTAFSRDGVSREFLLRLLRTIPPTEYRDVDSAEVLKDLAEAAQLVTGKRVASDTELRALIPKTGKGVSEADTQASLAAIPSLYEAMWKKLIAALAKG